MASSRNRLLGAVSSLLAIAYGLFTMILYLGKAIEDGMIGQLIMSQGSYHRNSTQGEWNYTIDPDAGPSAIVPRSTPS